MTKCIRYKTKKIQIELLQVNIEMKNIPDGVIGRLDVAENYELKETHGEKFSTLPHHPNNQRASKW